MTDETTKREPDAHYTRVNVLAQELYAKLYCSEHSIEFAMDALVLLAANTLGSIAWQLKMGGADDIEIAQYMGSVFHKIATGASNVVRKRDDATPDVPANIN